MGVVLAVIAWTAALAITAGVFGGVFLAIREPLRAWRRGSRREAILVGAIVAIVLLVMFAASQVVP
jgi:hypothetical protein